MRRILRRHLLRLRGALAMRRYVRAVEAIQGGFSRPDMEWAEYICPSLVAQREYAMRCALEARSL